VFDLLQLDGEDLRPRSRCKRCNVLYWYRLPAARVQTTEHVETHGEALFDVIASEDHERLVAKRIRCTLPRLSATDMAQDQESRVFTAPRGRVPGTVRVDASPRQSSVWHSGG
jgi:hypothetical protein